MIKISICGNTVEELQKHLPELSRLLTYYVEPQPGVRESKTVDVGKLEHPEAAAIESGELTLEDPKKSGRPVGSGKTGRVNKPGAGRKPKDKSTAKKLDRLRRAVKNDPQEIDIDNEPEVAEPANKHIMDAFDKEQEALLALEEKESAPPPVEELGISDIESLLQDAETPATPKAAAPTWDEVNKVIVELCNKKRAQGQNGVEVLKSLLASFNVKKAGELKPSVYSNFIQKARSLI
jgi:hypothetical protein